MSIKSLHLSCMHPTWPVMCFRCHELSPFHPPPYCLVLYQVEIHNWCFNFSGCDWQPHRLALYCKSMYSVATYICILITSLPILPPIPPRFITIFVRFFLIQSNSCMILHIVLTFITIHPLYSCTMNVKPATQHMRCSCDSGGCTWSRIHTQYPKFVTEVNVL